MDNKIRCTNCGWENEESAGRCIKCNQPLDVLLYKKVNKPTNFDVSNFNLSGNNGVNINSRDTLRKDIPKKDSYDITKIDGIHIRLEIPEEIGYGKEVYFNKGICNTVFTLKGSQQIYDEDFFGGFTEDVKEYLYTSGLLQKNHWEEDPQLTSTNQFLASVLIEFSFHNGEKFKRNLELSPNSHPLFIKVYQLLQLDSIKGIINSYETKILQSSIKNTVNTQWYESSDVPVIYFKMLKNRYGLIDLIKPGKYRNLWYAYDEYSREKVSIMLPSNLSEDSKIFEVYKFLNNFKSSNILSPYHIDVTADNEVFIIGENISRRLDTYIARINYGFAQNIFMNFLALFDDLAKIGKFAGALSPLNLLIGKNNKLLATEESFLEFATYNNNGYITLPKSNIAYIAPECFRNSKVTNSRNLKSDIWSMGAIIYELITGNKPFGDEGGEALNHEKNYQAYFNFYSTVELDLEKLSLWHFIINRCLDKNPDNRPSIRFFKNLFDIYIKKDELQDRVFNIVHREVGIIYTIECDFISNFHPTQVPSGGPATPLSALFYGAYFEDGDNCGFLKLLDNGKIVKYAKMSKKEFKDRRRWT